MSNRAWLLLGAGYAIWALAFVVLYAMLSVGCQFGWHEKPLLGPLSLQRAQLILLFLLHAGAGLTLVIHTRRMADLAPFLHQASILTGVAAFASTLFTFLAIFFLSPCH